MTHQSANSFFPTVIFDQTGLTLCWLNLTSFHERYGRGRKSNMNLFFYLKVNFSDRNDMQKRALEMASRKQSVGDRLQAYSIKRI